ncbi:MAG: hypothetical protein WC683_20500 [bacterium]
MTEYDDAASWRETITVALEKFKRLFPAASFDSSDGHIKSVVDRIMRGETEAERNRIFFDWCSSNRKR